MTATQHKEFTKIDTAALAHWNRAGSGRMSSRIRTVIGYEGMLIQLGNSSRTLSRRFALATSYMKRTDATEVKSHVILMRNINLTLQKHEGSTFSVIVHLQNKKLIWCKLSSHKIGVKKAQDQQPTHTSAIVNVPSTGYYTISDTHIYIVTIPPTTVNHNNTSNNETRSYAKNANTLHMNITLSCTAAL